MWYSTPGQYALIDLKAGTTRPVLPQPIDQKIRVGTENLLWLDGRRVVLFGAMLPLSGVDARERTRRAATREILEVDTQTGQTELAASPGKVTTAESSGASLSCRCIRQPCPGNCCLFQAPG